MQGLTRAEIAGKKLKVCEAIKNHVITSKQNNRQIFIAETPSRPIKKSQNNTSISLALKISEDIRCIPPPVQAQPINHHISNISLDKPYAPSASTASSKLLRTKRLSKKKRVYI